MLSARPLGSTLNVKRSKHKKLGAFSKVSSKRSDAVCQTVCLCVCVCVCVCTRIHFRRQALQAQETGRLF